MILILQKLYMNMRTIRALSAFLFVCFAKPLIQTRSAAFVRKKGFSRFCFCIHKHVTEGPDDQQPVMERYVSFSTSCLSRVLVYSPPPPPPTPPRDCPVSVVPYGSCRLRTVCPYSVNSRQPSPTQPNCQLVVVPVA